MNIFSYILYISGQICLDVYKNINGFYEKE